MARPEPLRRATPRRTPSSSRLAPPCCAPPVPVRGSAGAVAGRGAAAGFCAAGALGRWPVGTWTAGVAVRGAVVGAGVAVRAVGVGVAAAPTVRLSWTAVPSTFGSVPVCVAGAPPTVKLTVLPGVVQPAMAWMSTMYWLPDTLPKPHATPPIVAVTVAPD